MRTSTWNYLYCLSFPLAEQVYSFAHSSVGVTWREFELTRYRVLCGEVARVDSQTEMLGFRKSVLSSTAHFDDIRNRRFVKPPI